MGKLFIKNAGELITCAGGKGLNIIKDGAVLIEEGIITRVGRTQELVYELNEKECKVIDAKGKPVLPGFVDPHTHFVFAGYRDDEFCWRLQGIPYAEIMKRGGGIIKTVDSTRAAAFEELKELSRKRLDSMLSFGVTTVEGKTGYGLDLETELKQIRVMKKLDEEHPIDVVITFLGAHATPPEYKNNSDGYVRYLIEEVLPVVVQEGGVEFCDVFCDQGVFTVEQTQKILFRAQELGLKPRLHADEIAQVGGAELAAEIGAVSADHLLKVSDQGIKMMARAGVVPVLLPITAFNLKEPYAPARKMIETGLPIALATDLNPGSCYSESIPLLFALSTLYMELSIEEAILALTINAAAAINREKQIGSIEVGKQGDIVILDAPSYTHLAYHIGINSVEKVIKKGQLVVDNCK